MTKVRRTRIDRRKALTRWSKLVRETAGNKCEVCHKGGKGKVDAHHILDRVLYPGEALQPMCGIALCKQHHKFGKFSFHRNSLWASEWLKHNKPQQWNWCMECIEPFFVGEDALATGSTMKDCQITTDLNGTYMLDGK